MLATLIPLAIATGAAGQKAGEEDRGFTRSVATTKTHPTVNPGTPEGSTPPGADTKQDIVQSLRAEVLRGPYGTVPIEEVVQALRDIPGGPEIQDALKALACRKEEALPLVQEKLRSGDWYEKHMMTKLLRHSPWPEVYKELIDLARDDNGHPLAREGALIALGSLGDLASGPVIASVLRNPSAPPGIQLVAIATLARIGYHEGVIDIVPFAEHEDIHIRLFANHALAELGGPVQLDFLLAALDHDDYVVRDEAAGALWAVPGDDITNRLRALAANDENEAVRISASRSLIQREIHGRSRAGKLQVLKNALERADRRTSIWIVQTILAECAAEGPLFVEQLAHRDDTIGERARTFLVWNIPQLSASVFSLSTAINAQKADSQSEITPLHAQSAHLTLMGRAVERATSSLGLPISSSSTARTRMLEGSVQEDNFPRPRNSRLQAT